MLASAHEWISMLTNMDDVISKLRVFHCAQWEEVTNQLSMMASIAQNASKIYLFFFFKDKQEWKIRDYYWIKH